MKLNLLINGYPLNGYLNIDPLTQPGDPSKIQHDLNNLDDLVDNNECEEVVAYDVLDAFPLTIKGQILSHWMAKVEHNGIFILSGVDTNKVAVTMNSLNTAQLNMLLYGQCNHLWTIKKGLWSMDDAVNFIQSNGQFNVIEKSFANVNYVIKAKRL